MSEYAYFIASIVIAVLGIGFYYMGPALRPLQERLDAEVERLKKGESRENDASGGST